MNGEQEKELLDYLETLGFKSEDLTKEIREKQALNSPGFNVKFSKSYGDEGVIFDLSFKRDYQFNAYRLEQYEASHRSPVTIEHSRINSVDTAQLEERMKAVDWESYFKNGRQTLNERSAKQVDTIMDDLVKLEANNNANGWQTQRLLQYKYWPENTYDAAALPFKNELGHHKTFVPHESGMCNADLAFHILSRRLDTLYEKLEPAGLDQYPGPDLYIELEKALASNPDKFDLKFSRNEPDGFVEFSVPVSKVDGWYEADTFNATLTPYPPIEHGTYNGIDTAELESLMREIDWHNDRQLFIFHEDSEPEFRPKVGVIQEQMYRLSLDAVGADIADQLQLKYWSDATFFSDMLQQTAWDHLDTLPKRTQDFPLETDARAAFNMLCGRAAMEINLKEPAQTSGDWTRLNMEGKDENGKYPMERIKGYSREDLEKILDNIPIPQASYYPVRNSLLRGDLIAVDINNDRKIVIEANPEQRTVNIYTPDMRPIPVNLNFDPDWKPGIKDQPLLNQPSEKNKPTNQKYPHPKPIKKSKGRGL